jgi:quercetin dioxygenase-like cupin family protein
MKINRGREAGAGSERRTDTFSGEVWADPVLEKTGIAMVNNVFFAPGARTHWHRHEHGQILYVTSGRGRVYARDGHGGTIAAGDIVHIPPGEEHWHGAGGDSYLVHLAVSLGASEWLEPVTDEDYERGADA